MFILILFVSSGAMFQEDCHYEYSYVIHKGQVMRKSFLCHNDMGCPNKMIFPWEGQLVCQYD